MLLNEISLEVIFLDGSNTCGGDVESFDFIVLNDAPGDSCVGCSGRLALIHDCGATSDQWSVNDEIVPDNPPNVRGREHDIFAMNVIDVLESIVIGC